MSNIDNDADPQDRAEVLDETHLTTDGRNIANFDEVSDVYDATSAPGDSDIDEVDRDERDDTGLRANREDRSFAYDEDRIGTDQERPSNYEASAIPGDQADGDEADPSEDVPNEKDPHVDRQLDKGLKETFPASDPVSINPGAD